MNDWSEANDDDCFAMSPCLSGLFEREDVLVPDDEENIPC